MKTASNGAISIDTAPTMGGAITSLVWNGKEFINSSDHGREYQVAWIENNQHECNNPTEAGSTLDGLFARPTSSVLLGLNFSGNVMATASHPAYWTRPGTRSGGCSAVNTTLTTASTLYKNVTIGYGGDPRVIQFLTQIDLANAVSALQVEAPTAYLKAEFTNLFRFDPFTGELAGVPAHYDEPGGMKAAIISTADGAYAMGAYAAVPDGWSLSYGMGYFGPSDGYVGDLATSKWSIVLRRGALPAGRYGFTSYQFVGTLAEVQASMRNFVGGASASAPPAAPTTPAVDPALAACDGPVRQAYRDLNGREAEPAGLEFYKRVCAASGVAEMRRQIYESPESTAFVTRSVRALHLYVLGRASVTDAQIAAVRSDVLRDGIGAVTRTFQMSDESIKNLHTYVLGRPSVTQAQIDDIRARIGAAGYAVIRDAFEKSDESIKNLHVYILGRPTVTQAQLDDIRARIGAAGYAVIRDAFEKSDESIKNLHVYILGRPTVTQAQIDDIRPRIGAVGYAVIRDIFEKSDESIKNLHVYILGRPSVTQAQLDDIRARIGAVGYAVIRDVFEKSDEAIKNLHVYILGRPSVTQAQLDDIRPRIGAVGYAVIRDIFEKSDESIKNLHVYILGRPSVTQVQLDDIRARIGAVGYAVIRDVFEKSDEAIKNLHVYILGRPSVTQAQLDDIRARIGAVGYAVIRDVFEKSDEAIGNFYVYILGLPRVTPEQLAYERATIARVGYASRRSDFEVCKEAIVYLHTWVLGRAAASVTDAQVANVRNAIVTNGYLSVRASFASSVEGRTNGHGP